MLAEMNLPQNHWCGFCKATQVVLSRSDLQDKPDALFVGLPPSYHGSIDDNKADIELQLARVITCWCSPKSQVRM